MKEFNIGRLKKARVWIGELPNLSYPVRSSVETVLEAKPSALTGVQCAAVEFFAFISPRVLYGMLGATFAPNQSGHLVIQVAESEDYGEVYEESLAGSKDRVHVGISSEFAGCVLQAAAAWAEVKQLGPGLLLFNRGAHGGIGSAEVIFRHLARAVVHILASGASSVSAEEIDEYLTHGGERASPVLPE